jgi:hypothetical protein
MHRRFLVGGGKHKSAKSGRSKGSAFCLVSSDAIVAGNDHPNQLIPTERLNPLDVNRVTAETSLNEGICDPNFHQVPKSEIDTLIIKIDLGPPESLITRFIDPMTTKPANDLRGRHPKQLRGLRWGVQPYTDEVRVFHFWISVSCDVTHAVTTIGFPLREKQAPVSIILR